MAHKFRSDVQDEQRVAKAERQKLKQELAEQAAKRPSKPRNRRRVVTLIALAVVAVLAGLFGLLTLWPSSTPSSPGGVPVGTAAPEFALPGREYHITYPLLFDPGDRVNLTYGVTAIPTTYFIDSSGVVRSVFVTQLSPRTMQQGLASVGITLP